MPATVVDSNVTHQSPFVTALVSPRKFDNQTTLTYYLKPSDWDNNGIDDWVQTGAGNLIRAAYAQFAAVINLQIAEVGTEGEANYVESILSPGSFSGTGYHTLPFATGVGGYDIMQFYADPTFNVVGANNSRLFIHEVGHGLGLFHPHDGQAQWPGVTSSDDTGDFDLNSGAYSIMSYVPFYDILGNATSPTFGYFGGPLAFDIAALQALYGPNLSTRAGNDTYDIPTINDVGTFYWSVWDAGGVDLIRNNSSLDSVIDMRAATLLDAPGGGGWYSRASGIKGGFTIANGVTIENAQGGSGKDNIQGNDAANQIDGGGGNDTLAGGGGADTLTGGAGSDRFSFLVAGDSTEAAPDLIADFNPLEDSIDVELLAVRSASATVEGGVTRLSLATANGAVQINLNGAFTLAQLLPGLRPLIEGTPQVDALGGTASGDAIFGFDSADSITGLAGADLLVGGLGSDVIEGGDGDDTILGGLAANPAGADDGDDNLAGGAGNDQLFGGFGNDTLDGGSGTNRLEGEAGDDRFLWSPANAGALTTMIGGSGLDTLVIDGTGGGALFVSGGAIFNEVRARMNGQEVFSFIGIERFEAIGSEGNDVLQGPFSQHGSVISGRGGDDQMTSGYGDDLLIGDAGNDYLSGAPGNDRLIGGAGADLLDGGMFDTDTFVYLDPTDSTDAAQDKILAFETGLDRIDLSALGAVTVSWTAQTDQQDGSGYSLVSVATANGTMSIRVNGTVVDSDFIRQGSPLTGSTANDRFNGFAGADQFFMQQGGNDQVFAKEGNDGIYFGGAMTNADSADGGPGTDTLALQGNYAGLVFGSGVRDIEVVFLAPGNDTRFGDTAGNSYDYALASVDANVAAGGTLTLVGGNLRPGEDFSFDGSAETDGRFRIFAGQGVDNHKGGAGSDGFFFGADGNLTGADRVNGGGGTDSIALRGNYFGPTAVVFQNASFTAVEVLTFLSGHTNEFGGIIDVNGFDYDVTLANGNIAAGQRLDVIASNLRANESARVDARAETDGTLRVLSGAGDDHLFGGAGNDILYGGLGADALDGSGGADSYLYRAAGESTAASRDTLAFAAGDKIDLSLIDADTGSAGTNEAFAFIGSAAFSNVAGQLRAFQSGGQWIVEGDVNGDGVAELVIAATSAAPIVAESFVL